MLYSVKYFAHHPKATRIVKYHTSHYTGCPSMPLSFLHCGPRSARKLVHGHPWTSGHYIAVAPGGGCGWANAQFAPRAIDDLTAFGHNLCKRQVIWLRIDGHIPYFKLQSSFLAAPFYQLPRIVCHYLLCNRLRRCTLLRTFHIILLYYYAVDERGTIEVHDCTMCRWRWKTRGRCSSRQCSMQLWLDYISIL